MEPVFRPSCRLFHTLPTFITRSFRNFKAAARFIRLKPQIAGFGSQRMCPSCGSITSRSNAFCLACGKSFPAVHQCTYGEKMRRNKTVIVVRIVFALLILYAIFGLTPNRALQNSLSWYDSGHSGLNGCSCKQGFYTTFFGPTLPSHL